MRRSIIWILMVCCFHVSSVCAIADNTDSSNQLANFVSFKELYGMSGLKLYQQEKVKAILTSHDNNLLYIDLDKSVGFLNDRKLSFNQDFTVSNGEILISKNILDNLIQKNQDKSIAAKKIYALYHGFRRTRLYDGDLGTWKIFYRTEASRTGIQYINYNPDILDKNGYPQVASSNGIPIVGMQSDSDPDNIEYKILLAKTALIDGFIVDYVFPEHSNTILIKNFMDVAKKYNFEIGVDWLDASVYSNWIQNYPGYEHIKSREQKTEYGKFALRYAWENFYSQPTEAKWNDRPLFFIFGGETPAELESIISSMDQMNSSAKPIYIRRSQLWGKEVGKGLVWDDLKSYYPKWHDIGVDIFSWKATCVRSTAGIPEYSQWDKYASWEDNFNFAKQYVEMWQDNQKVRVNTACVWPGFDNKACAEWGKGTFSVIDRKDGTLYRSLWDYYLQHKSLIDIVFIASWSDFTEGHEIEPTVKNGYREILSTLDFANKFKDDQYTYGTQPIYYPEKIFRLRKLARKYHSIGIETDNYQRSLDLAAFAVSRRYYQIAENLIKSVEASLDQAKERFDTKEIRLSLDNNGFSVINSKDSLQNNIKELSGSFEIIIPEKITSLLRDKYYEGQLNFSYYGDNHQNFQVTADTKKPLPLKLGLTQGDYSVIADITKNNTNEWEKCKVILYSENIKLSADRNKSGHIRYSGSTRIKDISIALKYYEIKK